MANEDQEHFADYLELERYIAALQTGKVAHPPKNLAPEQAQIYQMAALFRSASPENAEPRPEFVEQLKAQLLSLREDQQPALSKDASKPPEAPTSTTQPAEIPSQPTSSKKKISKPVRFLSRRGLLMGGAAAAASFAIGGASEHIMEQNIAQNSQNNPTIPPTTDTLKITSGLPTSWHFVATLADLGQTAVRFASDTLIGYVLRDTDTATSHDPDKGNVIAMSAACTHMGCIVQWEDADRHFHCPCHSAMFTEYGVSANANYRYTLPPLPRLNTKVEDGKVYVEVPLKQK